MAAISAVFTIGYVATLLGEDENWIFDLSISMCPEDGCLWVHGVGENGVPAFTRDGIENLRQIIADERAADRGPTLRRSPNAYGGPARASANARHARRRRRGDGNSDRSPPRAAPSTCSRSSSESLDAKAARLLNKLETGGTLSMHKLLWHAVVICFLSVMAFPACADCPDG